MILIIGGAGCGKSRFAEALCQKMPAPRYYLAAMQPYGSEGEARIQKHRAMREGKGFETVERYTDYSSLKLPHRGTALLECVANLTANEMYSSDGSMSDPFERVINGIGALAAQCAELVVVTNDVGSDGIQYDPSTQAYIRSLGRINAALAARADTMIEMVAGIPTVQKGAIPEQVLQNSFIEGKGRTQMILVIGGAGAGKRSYARSLGYAESDFSSDPYDNRPVLTGLETLVREHPDQAGAAFDALLQKELVLCDEVGSGVIPLTGEDRAYREAVGALCVRLAKEAAAVVRVVAGIPSVIKGSAG